LILVLTLIAIWVKWWAASNTEAPNQRLGYYLGIYGLLGAGALFSLVISCWFVNCSPTIPKLSSLFVSQAIDHHHGATIRRTVSFSLATDGLEVSINQGYLLKATS
jgi:hypothetical protein